MKYQSFECGDDSLLNLFRSSKNVPDSREQIMFIQFVINTEFLAFKIFLSKLRHLLCVGQSLKVDNGKIFCGNEEKLLFYAPQELVFAKKHHSNQGCV